VILVLCCGGRDFTDQAFVDAKLNEAREKYGDLFIIHGGARGADTCCGLWGIKNGLPVAVVNANWDIHGKKAGPIRNAWMLELRPNVGIAFPGGFGTRNMINQLKAAGIPVWQL
jgi:hypothetical protein